MTISWGMDNYMMGASNLQMVLLMSEMFCEGCYRGDKIEFLRLVLRSWLHKIYLLSVIIIQSVVKADTKFYLTLLTY